MPIVGLESAIAELRHSREIGHRGVILSRFPSGGFELVPEALLVGLVEPRAADDPPVMIAGLKGATTPLRAL